MRDIKNVLICGLGAIGSIYADKIQKFNPDSLRVLVDEERFERYSSNPIIFNGNELHFNYILPNDNGFKADLVIIATKYDGLSDVIKNMKNFIQSDTVILALLNGVTSEKIIAETYGREKLLYSYFIGHSAVRTGRNVIHDDVNTIVYGSENTADIENVQRVKKYFDSVGINYKIPEDIMHSLWLKYMLNVSANQSTAILKLTFGEMLANEKCMDFAINIMKEVQKEANEEYRKQYEDYFRSLGYKIKHKWTFKDFLTIILVIGVLVVIFGVLWLIPPTHEYMINLYNTNLIVKIITDIIIGIFQGIIKFFKNFTTF